MIKNILYADSSYPVSLKEVENPPPEVFIKGKIIPKDVLAVSIVGSRIASEYGKATARKFATELSKAGVTIISGLARGIDTEAHLAALAAGGRTIAVMAGGLDKIYPPENKKLAQKIAKNGALISEFPPVTQPIPKNFLQRNRIIAGLSIAVVVIEGKRRSGTLSTAKFAGEMGREVFAVPGPVNSPLSEAPIYLIEQGASVAKSPEDVLEYINELKY